MQSEVCTCSLNSQFKLEEARTLFNGFTVAKEAQLRIYSTTVPLEQSKYRQFLQKGLQTC